MPNGRKPEEEAKRWGNKAGKEAEDSRFLPNFAPRNSKRVTYEKIFSPAFGSVHDRVARCTGASRRRERGFESGKDLVRENRGEDSAKRVPERGFEYATGVPCGAGGSGEGGGVPGGLPAVAGERAGDGLDYVAVVPASEQEFPHGERGRDAGIGGLLGHRVRVDAQVVVVHRQAVCGFRRIRI